MRRTSAPCPRTRRDQWTLNALTQWPMRVPPDQSSTFPATFSSAASTSRWRRCRVTLVRRVPKTKVNTRSRSLVTACRKWSSIREYRLMEPETSHSATSGGGRRRRAERFRGMTSAPERSAERRVARVSIRGPRESGANRRVGAGAMGSLMRAMTALASAISSADIDSKSMDWRISCREYVPAASPTISPDSSSSSPSPRPGNSASSSRRLGWSCSASPSVRAVGSSSDIMRSRMRGLRQNT